MAAPKATIDERKAICRACPHATLVGPKKFLRLCSQCGCVLAAKVQMKRAKCPIGKW